MFRASVKSDWKVGSPITWSSKWKGKPFEDKGVVLKNDEGRLLQYTHFSPLSGLPDSRSNYHTVTITLSDSGRRHERDPGPGRQRQRSIARAFAEKLGGDARLPQEVRGEVDSASRRSIGTRRS